MNKVIIGLITLLLVVSACQRTTDASDELTGQIILDDDDFVFLEEEDPEPLFEDVVLTEDEEQNEEEPLFEDILTEEEAGTVVTQVEVEEADVEEDISYVIEVEEGELVALDLEATDPDGDTLEYEYTGPVNTQGRWQTQIGDEGRYLATITASDGKLSTSEDVLIIVNRANRAPTIECSEIITVDEGDTLVLDCNIYDEEGDNIVVSYEGWTTEAVKQTSYEDAGEYTVLVRASDEGKTATHKVTVFVNDVNREPLITELNDIEIMETQTAIAEVDIYDPDGDAVTVTYNTPLDENGVWVTDDGDAGTYEVVVTASDGELTVSDTFTVTVTQINTAPVLKPISDIEISEGETITIPVNAYDPEGDELIITYSGFMSRASYTTSYEDAGEYEQTVIVSDGALRAEQSFTIIVNDENRPPVFEFPED